MPPAATPFRPSQGPEAALVFPRGRLTPLRLAWQAQRNLLSLSPVFACPIMSADQFLKTLAA
jgi:hypothetical protein